MISNRGLFLHLFVPLVQRIMDEYVEEKNSYRTRTNHKSSLPTGVPPDVSYHLPEDYGGVEGLIPVPPEAVQTILDEVYPDREELFMISPPRFHALIEDLIVRLGWSGVHVDLSNVWELYSHLLSRLEEMDLDLDELALTPLPLFNDDNASDYSSEEDEESDDFLEHDDVY